MKRQIIAIDIDDVIADSTESLREQVNIRLGIKLTKEDYRVVGEMWGYYERVWEQHGLSDQIQYAEYEAEMSEDQSHVPFLPGATFAMAELAKHFDIVLITARNPVWEPATRVWLKDYLGTIIRDVHFAGNKYVEGAKSKGVQARETGASYLIDDGPENCRSALEEGITPILFGEYGWHFDAPTSITRCKDWPAVLEYFDGIR